ncbi:mitochondrial 18 KDa protein (MTP18) domain-containing protein [Ditylenchus destructor]|uniref:glutathione transferase n=1 Tax=Ditylenchus destructor TaxID=166010 RepID=A0AAD4MHK7_9BILA|nr:mitochondrial 18 KDa protein (MTP18) domain-containing protein [Ditylenchus destructor]
MTAAALPVKIDLGDQEDDKNGILADDITVNPCEKPDSYFRTLFGKVHVEIAAQCIAIGSLIFQIVFHYNFHMDPSEPNLGKVIPEPFLYYTNISVLVCVLVAKNKRIAMLYWPFLAYYALIGATCAAVLGHGAFKIYCELSGSCSGLYWTRTVTNAIVIVSILVGELLLDQPTIHKIGLHSKMVHYKLTYFNTRGLAEMSRSMPYGNVPVLEVDGIKITQSFAIARFLARRYGLAGKSDIESALLDSIADLHKDYHKGVSVTVLYSTLRYINEVGEAFRAWVHVSMVRLSYVIASEYVVADALDKSHKAYKSATEWRKHVALTMADTLTWQFASVIAIPFIVKPIDALNGFDTAQVLLDQR